MKLLLPVAFLLSAVALLPAPAQAHLCHLDDPVCVAQCIVHAETGGDPCSVRALDPPGFEPCPSGEAGVVATVGGRTVRACAGVPTVTAGSCAPGETGIVVYVDNRPVTLCASLA